jgi:hypothetical protein
MAGFPVLSNKLGLIHGYVPAVIEVRIHDRRSGDGI